MFAVISSSFNDDTFFSVGGCGCGGVLVHSF
jgi:hypothetical protein